MIKYTTVLYIHIFVHLSGLHLFSKLKDEKPTWLYWFFLFWWFLCITSLTKETLQGFAAWARKHRHAKRSKPHLFPDLPLNCNPPPHHYDNHHDYSPPPSQKMKSPFFALPCLQLQSCLGNLDRLQLASAVVVLLVARHRQVARLDIVGTYKMSSSKKWESQYSQRLFGAKVRVLIRRRLCKNKQYTIYTFLSHWYGLV